MAGVSSELTGDVRWIRFGRPQALNALMLDDLAAARDWVLDPGAAGPSDAARLGAFPC